MKAIILAAGRGSRMKKLTKNRPKCLVELHGRPLLDWQLKSLRSAGVKEIAIVTGYKREMLADRGLVEFHNDRWHKTNMVSSLCYAQNWLSSEPCIVSYSDIFYSPAAVRSLINCSASLAVTYDPNWLEIWKQRFNDPLEDAETFLLTPDNILTEIGKKPKSVDEITGQFMGLLRFTPHGWREVSRIRSLINVELCDKMHMTETLQKIIETDGVNISAIPYNDAWGEVDSVHDLHIFQNNLAKAPQQIFSDK